MNKHLTFNARYWAQCYFDVFSAGCVATSRGESMDVRLKGMLRKNNILPKGYANCSGRFCSVKRERERGSILPNAMNECISPMYLRMHTV
jgi:hypothetical protein